MKRAAVALAVCALALPGCDRNLAPAAATPAAGPAASATAAAASAPAAPAAPRSITLRAALQPGAADLLFTLQADAAPPSAGALKVRAIEIHRSAGGGLLQRIEGLDTETPWTHENPGLEFIDLNFDGYADLRLIEQLPAGPNVPRLNWLYDPASARFVANPALNAITALRVDAAKQELLSDWTDGPTREGVDVYAWRNGQLQPLRRDARQYTVPGRYTLTQSRWVDGAWQVVAKKKGP